MILIKAYVGLSVNFYIEGFFRQINKSLYFTVAERCVSAFKVDVKR